MTVNQIKLMCPKTKTISTRDILDRDVYDLEHKSIGVVSDVVFEANNGMVPYITCMSSSRNLSGVNDTSERAH